jgi:hypothetical protein
VDYQKEMFEARDEFWKQNEEKIVNRFVGFKITDDLLASINVYVNGLIKAWEREKLYPLLGTVSIDLCRITNSVSLIWRDPKSPHGQD